MHENGIDAFHQFVHQSNRVGVTPLEIVEPQNERIALRDAGKAIAESGERAVSLFAGIRNVGRSDDPRGSNSRRTGNSRERRRNIVAGGRGLSMNGQSLEKAREMVDELIEALMGRSLALVAPAAQYDAFGLLISDAIDEPPGNSSFAYS